jgi:hypothetical protein
VDVDVEIDFINASLLFLVAVIETRDLLLVQKGIPKQLVSRAWHIDLSRSPSSDHRIIVGVRTNPKPMKSIVTLNCQSAIA